jgi:hypothetical protein
MSLGHERARSPSGRKGDRTLSTQKENDGPFIPRVGRPVLGPHRRHLPTFTGSYCSEVDGRPPDGRPSGRKRQGKRRAPGQGAEMTTARPLAGPDARTCGGRWSRGRTGRPSAAGRAIAAPVRIKRTLRAPTVLARYGAAQAPPGGSAAARLCTLSPGDCHSTAASGEPPMPLRPLPDRSELGASRSSVEALGSWRGLVAWSPAGAALAMPRATVARGGPPLAGA